MSLIAFTNVFAGNPIDRASEQRHNADWLAACFNDPQSMAIALRAGDPLVSASADGAMRLAFFPVGLAAELPDLKERCLFLGLLEKVAIFAIDFDASESAEDGILRGRGNFDSLRDFALLLPLSEAAIAATAKGVFEWHHRHRFCSACGHASEITDGGWKRVCPACAAPHFPRTDPVVIMLPTRGDTCLLGRQASWPEGMWSALAGFMEPGETIEEACARELKEEAALEAISVRYHSSQPWPYPSSLMIGLFAEVAAGEAVADQTEIEAVRWFTRQDIRDVLDQKIEGVRAPSGFAIAHTLLKVWAYEGFQDI